jgi:hypothetical protein
MIGQVFLCYTYAENEAYTVENTETGQPADPKIKQPRNWWWIRLVGYIERKLHERKTKKENENPVDRAARLTAKATVWIAVFTVLMAVVALGTLYEIIIGGSDTHSLAEAANDQSRAAMVQAIIQVPGTPSIQADWVGVYLGYDKPFVDIRFRNAGGGVALDAKVAIYLTFGTSPPVRPYRISQERYQELGKMLLPTSAGTGPAPRQSEKALSEKETATLMSNGARAYVWGVVEYRTFDNARIIQIPFCRCTSAKEVLSRTRFASQQDIDEGKATTENRVAGNLDDCYGK